MVMPELLRWFQFLSARLRHVRIVNGDWQRVCTNSTLKTLSVRKPKGFAGVFLDPPYAQSERDPNLYSYDQAGVSDKVRAWCLENGADPNLRIVLAGFENEHSELENHGWAVKSWFKKSFLKGGMGVTGKKGTQMHRDRLWFSPNCLISPED